MEHNIYYSQIKFLSYIAITLSIFTAILVLIVLWVVLVINNKSMELLNTNYQQQTQFIEDRDFYFHSINNISIWVDKSLWKLDYQRELIKKCIK